MGYESLSQKPSAITTHVINRLDSFMENQSVLSEEERGILYSYLIQINFRLQLLWF